MRSRPSEGLTAQRVSLKRLGAQRILRVYKRRRNKRCVGVQIGPKRHLVAITNSPHFLQFFRSICYISACCVASICAICGASLQNYFGDGRFAYLRCSGCRHVILHPIPTEVELKKFYTTSNSELWNTGAFSILEDYVSNPEVTFIAAARKNRPLSGVSTM
jgi:hypothetical protein